MKQQEKKMNKVTIRLTDEYLYALGEIVTRKIGGLKGKSKKALEFYIQMFILRTLLNLLNKKGGVK